MAFHEERFPANLSFGSLGGPERRTDVVTLSNGFEERNTPWAHSRRRYDAGVGMRSLEDLEELIAFFEARRGQLFAFRWKDWADYKSCSATATPDFDDQLIGVGDGSRSEFPLLKRYRSGADTYDRPISKPVLGSVTVGLQGDQKTETIDYALDITNGVISFFDPPTEGTRVTAGFEFDVPVRFDTDRIQTSVASFRAGEVPSVPVVEVRV